MRSVYKEHLENRGARPDIAFLLQDWDDPYNVGGMFRVADACGAIELVMSGHTPVPPDPQIHVTSMGQHRRIPWKKFDRHEEAALAVKAAGYQLVAIEISEGAVPYTEFDYSKNVCLALGNEGRGLYSGVTRHCDAAVFIPMLGKGKSLNVHVAAAIVAFEILRKSGI